MKLLVLLTLAVKFAVEIGALTAVYYWGGIMPALVVSFFWALVVSPKAPVSMPKSARNLLGCAICVGAAVLLDRAGQLEWSAYYAGVAVVNTTMLILLRA